MVQLILHVLRSDRILISYHKKMLGLGAWTCFTPRACQTRAQVNPPPLSSGSPSFKWIYPWLLRLYFNISWQHIWIWKGLANTTKNTRVHHVRQMTLQLKSVESPIFGSFSVLTNDCEVVCCSTFTFADSSLESRDWQFSNSGCQTMLNRNG